MTKNHILAKANLFPRIRATPILEYYPRIPLLFKANYFSQESFLIDVRNYASNNESSVTINRLKLTKIYLVRDQREKYYN